MCRNKKSDIYLCGDFNVYLLNYGSETGTRNFVDSLFSLGLFPFIDRPSRITDHSASLIDNIFTNVINTDIKSGLLINDISDHLPVFSITDYSIYRRNVQGFVYNRRLDEGSLSSFYQSLNQVSWDMVYAEDDVHKAYDHFIDIIMKLYNECCPVRKMSIKTIKSDKAWVTKGLKNACKKKKTLYIKFLKKRISESEQRYKTYKNKLNSVLKFCKREYFTDLLESQKNNMKGTWKVLNDIIRKKYQKQTECFRRGI